MTSFSGYVMMDDKILCADFWDLNAAKVVCSASGFGEPKEVFGDFRFGNPLQEYYNMTPVCTGIEDSIEDCKFRENLNNCIIPAGVSCNRISELEGITMIDGFAVCSENFTKNEASAICKEKGYVKGDINHETVNSRTVKHGHTLHCRSPNIENCEVKKIGQCTAASFSCEKEAELELFGGSLPGEGHLLFKGGLVCDDFWDIQV